MCRDTVIYVSSHLLKTSELTHSQAYQHGHCEREHIGERDCVREGRWGRGERAEARGTVCVWRGWGACKGEGDCVCKGGGGMQR
jgi:hypothetical protein